MVHDVLGRPMSVNDIVLYAFEAFANTCLKKGKIIQIEKGDVYLKSENKTYRIPHKRIVVITSQLQHNYQEYPENYL